MSTKKNEKSFNDLLFGYQTRLQGVANDLGDKLARLISTTDADVLKLIVKELPRREKNVRAEIRRLERLIKKIEKTRAPGFQLGRDLVFQTARDVAELSSDQTVSEAAAARNEADFAVEKPRAKTVSKSALANIVDYQPIEGASIATWYSALQRKDLERIANVVTRAAVEGLTVSKIAREIRGTKESGYTDGILQTTRNGAVALARTVINGVSNNARIETIKENADSIDGARFVGTLDGKTCPHCGALDGAVWGPDELDKIRRPPLHVSCRCCVVPHVVLKGPDGKVYEIGSRPAANADFDTLAKEAYNKAAREKGIKRRWDDLSPSTRLKYYYKAQKDYERRTGKPAYRQVSPSTTFAEYFERQDDAFKRSWLGAKRYEAYRNGAAFGDLVKPAATYRATLPELSQTSETPTTANNALQTPKQAFDLPPLDLPELALPRLSGTPRQIEWSEDLRRRAVRDLTEERAAETARDNVRHWREWSSRRDAKNIRETLPELETAIAEVGGDDVAAQILGREAFLKAREYVEAWNDSRDWIDLKVEQKVSLNAYAAQKIAGTPKEAAAILRRYAADAKKTKRIQNDAARNKRQPAKTTPPTEPDAPQTPSVWSPSGPIKDAQSFLVALREYRAQKMAPEDAQKAEKEAQEYVKERAAAYAVCHRFRLSYQRYEKTRKKDVKAALLPQLQQELTAAVAETQRVGALRNARHGTVDRAIIFDWLFPDNGGSVIFDDTKRAEVENVFRKKFSKKGAVILSNGKNATAEDAAGVARSVLELYNKIGRSLGFDDAPRFANVVFRKLPLGTNGDYTPATREIRISSSLADRAELFDSFAHEIGHWFEHEVAGPDAATGSVQWLSDVTGDKKAFSVKGKEGKLLQLENCSTRFWSVDDYAATVYRKNSQKNADGSWKEFYDGEALSTAFEGLLEDPEAFALDAPEHFNRLMKVLSDYRNRPK